MQEDTTTREDTLDKCDSQHDEVTHNNCESQADETQTLPEPDQGRRESDETAGGPSTACITAAAMDQVAVDCASTQAKEHNAQAQVRCDMVHKPPCTIVSVLAHCPCLHLQTAVAVDDTLPALRGKPIIAC